MTTRFENGRDDPPLKEMLKKCLLQLFLFEISIKVLTILIGLPFMQFFMEFMLDLSNREIAFNEGILHFFTSWSGILGGLFLLAIVSIGIYFEFSVITLLIYHAFKRTPIDLEQAMKLAATKIRQLKHVSSLGFSLYTLAILPLANIGIASSILSSLDIPPFITGELQKTAIGNIAVYAFYALVFCLAWLFIFSLPIFALEKANYFKAIKQNFTVIKRNRKDFLGIGVLFLLVYLLSEFSPDFAQGYLFTMPVFYSPFDLFGLLSVNLTSLIQLLLLLIKVVYPIVLYALVVFTYLKTQPEILVEENPSAEAGGWLQRSLIYCQTWLNQKVFYQKHHKKIKIFLGLLIVWLFVANFSSPPVEEPFVIGHRGSLLGVENTIEAIDGAIDAEAEYVEIDILLSKDSVPMVIHDENLKRLAGIDKNVYDLTAEELQDITLSQNNYQGKISTLDEVLKFADGKIKLLIEYKSHKREEVNLIDSVMEVVEENEFKGDCIFQAMNFDYIRQMKRDYPEYPVGYTTYGSVGAINTDKIIDLDVDFLSVEESMVTPNMIKECNQAHVSVYVWTVNDPLAISSYVNDGAVGIITDLPDVAKEAIR